MQEIGLDRIAPVRGDIENRISLVGRKIVNIGGVSGYFVVFFLGLDIHFSDPGGQRIELPAGFDPAFQNGIDVRGRGPGIDQIGCQRNLI